MSGDSSQKVSPPSGSTDHRLTGQLTTARRRLFVGRSAELELFRQALVAAEPPFVVLYLFGPGGVGKTTLLGEYTRLAIEHGRRVYRLDSRDVDSSPEGFLHAFSQAVGAGTAGLTLDALATLPPAVLLLDTYERLSALDGWLRDTFLPRLPATTLVVIAGRQPPAEPWRTDPAWRELARIVSLRNLHPEESRQLLTTLGVPVGIQEAVLDLTYGHPLALVLLADWLTLRTTDEEISLERAPDVIRLLLERFLRDVPTPLHRQALEACALARVTTEALLVEVLGQEAAPAIFTWLRGLSFIETGQAGLFPHDLVRDVLETDLRWRNPEAWRQLYRQVRHHLNRRFWEGSDLARQQAFVDLIYLQRHQPAMKPFYDWKTLGSFPGEPATPQDYPHILAMVETHEGPESSRIAAYWLQRQPRAFVVFRGADSLPVGFSVNLLLDAITPEDEQSDPAVRTIWALVRRHGPVRPGERIQIARFWMGRETYQGPFTHNMITLNTVVTWLTTPNLAWTFCYTADPPFWEELFAYINFRRVAEADFQVGGRCYGGFAHDWRAEPLDVWREIMRERELNLDFKPEPIPQAAPPPLIVLSQSEFAEAVRQALRDFSATPKDQNGMYFPWVVCDYPLAQAVEDRIVKAPLIVTKEDDPKQPKDDPDGVTKDNIGEKYGYWIRAAVQRWKEHQEVYKQLATRPVLFIMAEKNGHADAIGEYLWKTKEFGFKESEVLVIHTDAAGEVSKKDLDKARAAARDIDKAESKIKVIVSVMMLREGWDVRNVTVVLGLRPFTAKAEILPEQVIGRGLRLMTQVSPDRTQTLEVLGTRNLLKVLRDQLEAEGVGVASTKTDPPPPVIIAPLQERLAYDIAIPITKPSLVHDILKLSDLKIEALDAIYDQEDLAEAFRVKLKLEFATTETEVHQADIAAGELPPVHELLASITNKVINLAKLPNRFAELYPFVRDYVQTRCFGKPVNLDGEILRSHLSRLELQEGIAKYLARKIAELTIDRCTIEFDKADFRLSETKPFSWRRNLPPLEAKKTVFNYVATYNDFERQFAEFLDRADDVARFASLGTTEQGESSTQFRVDYLKPSGAIGFYHPDWAVVQKTAQSEVNWIIETKGRVWQDTEAKDEAMRIWCERISTKTGTCWRYKRIDQSDFSRMNPKFFTELVDTKIQA